MSSKKVPSDFSLKFNVEIQEKEYKVLRNKITRDEMLVVVTFGLKLKEWLPSWLEMGPYSISYMLLSITTAILASSLLFGSSIRRGYFIMASRLASISIFLFAYGVIAIIPHNFHLYPLLYVLVFGTIIWKIWRELLYVINCYRENFYLGIYISIVNFGTYLIIIYPPFFSYLKGGF